MSDVVIRVDHIYKEYRLGTISHGTMYQDLQSWWAKMRGQEDPNSIIGKEQRAKRKESNAMRSAPGAPQGNPHFLALQDISFDVKRGEVLGIIGRNGAGKSTLLKILSEVTAPTKGVVKLKGRVASLLEVGTGFHPELTGRENVYLNGAILGMSRKETYKKFDEIVTFAEVEQFIDTPVKRYSSGMYVRLAFAVAAHLEPEILIVDEVLAVGDAAFQKKCLGKMGDVAEDGRTILFVSHNMGAVATLCSSGIYIEDGRIKMIDSSAAVVNMYQKSCIAKARENEGQHVFAFHEHHKVGITDFHVELQADNDDGCLDLKIMFNVIAEKYYRDIGIGIEIRTVSGIQISMLTPFLTNFVIEHVQGSVKCSMQCSDIGKYLSGGDYLISIWLSKPKVEYLLKLDEAFLFTIPPTDIFGTGNFFESHVHGIVPLPIKFETIQ